MKVTVGTKYRYNPVLFDRLDMGLQVSPGEIVHVINLPGAPKANVQGSCYVEDLAGNFIGLVKTNSLEKLGGTTSV